MEAYQAGTEIFKWKPIWTNQRVFKIKYFCIFSQFNAIPVLELHAQVYYARSGYYTQ